MPTQENAGHRPVTAASAEQNAWLGPVEAARQRKLLQVDGRHGDDAAERRLPDHPAKLRA